MVRKKHYASLGGSEFSSYKIELQNGVAKIDVALWVKSFLEIPFSSYCLNLEKKIKSFTQVTNLESKKKSFTSSY